MRHSDDLMTIQLDGLAEPAGTEGGLTTAANAWTPRSTCSSRTTRSW